MSQRLGMAHAKIILLILRYLWPEDPKIRWRLVIAGFTMAAAIALDVSVPIFFKKIVNTLSDPSHLTMVSFMVALGAYAFMWTSAQAFLQLREIVLYRVFQRAVRMLSLKVFDHLHAQSLGFHLNRQTGAITNAIERAQSALPDVAWYLLLFFIPVLIEVLIVCNILWSTYSFFYGLSVLLIVGVYIVFSIFASNIATRLQQHANITHMKSSAKIVDSLINFETVKYFSSYPHERATCDYALKEREDAMTKFLSVSTTFGIGQCLIIGAGLGWLTWHAGHQVMEGTMTVGDFVMVNGYLLQFATPLSQFGWMLRDMRKGLTDMENVLEITNVKSEIVDAAQAVDINPETFEIKFQNVRFNYNDRKPVLKGVSFDVPAGKTVAIVGTTGAGKSTISKLVFRLYDVSGGQILVNNQDIRTIKQESLQRLIGVVPQETILFNDTLLHNIMYGKPGASRREVKEAIRMAHLDQYIRSMPEGLFTMVGERGLKLSGGEKQRVGIARVALKRPKMYIFDEATSALDTQTEREIQRNLQEVSQGATTLIIAHRLSTITHADEIIVLHKGNIAERGNHQELLEKNGLYAKLWLQQAEQQAELAIEQAKQQSAQPSVSAENPKPSN